MAFTGTLRSWNDERGFGFIAPASGGRELFVHISAFPRDGSRPTVGETLTYELGRGKDGKPAAVRVQRRALRDPSRNPRSRPAVARHSRSLRATIVGILLVVVLGAFAYSKYQEYSKQADVQVQFRCDGRIDCSQMTSCSEAKYFLKNCPGVRMDGDNDGVPCERQWCTSPSEK